jgi:choline kinase
MRVSKAIFLVAGTSSRFRGVVDHKALLKLHGQTLLERQIVQATNLGITHFVFAIGAAPESIIKETIRVFYHYGIPYLQVTFIGSRITTAST